MLWLALRSDGETGPLGAQPLPRVLELAASIAAHFPNFDHPGGPAGQDSPCPVSLGEIVGLEAFREADRPGHAALEQYRVA